MAKHTWVADVLLDLVEYLRENGLVAMGQDLSTALSKSGLEKATDETGKVVQFPLQPTTLLGSELPAQLDERQRLSKDSVEQVRLDDQPSPRLPPTNIQNKLLRNSQQSPPHH